MKGTVLLTGATGFVGTWVTRWVLENTDESVLALVRGKDPGEAGARLNRAWWDWPSLREEVGSRVTPVPGDITQPDLGLSPEAIDWIGGEVDRVVHCAATVWFDRSQEEMERVNILGTRNMLDVARSINSRRGLDRFSHVSTAYVAGRRSGIVGEGELSDSHGFNNDYEWSKYQGERLVREAGSDIPITIFRPGMIVGDAQEGRVRTFNTLYIPLKLYLTGKLKLLPVRKDLGINMVPVDYVARSICEVTFDGKGEGDTLHLTPPEGAMPTALQLVSEVRRWAQERLDIDLPRPWFVRLPMTASPDSTYRLLAPYLNERRVFRRDNSDRLLGPYELDWKELLNRMLEFAIYHGFLHRSERTVQEQIVFRMRGRSMPVECADVVGGVTTAVPNSHLRSQMLRAASALVRMGVRKGDKVALVGYNSTRYLVLDVAIGLAGGVSVPLYYTSPPQEIAQILNDSGAKLLFVGAPPLIERLAGKIGDVRMVSMDNGALPEEVMGWEEFLGLGIEETPPCLVGPDDAATLRYTSSTTGTPKGVEFTHANMRWMAEAVASLFPWSARTSTVRYLSFLPLNHVVEGILGAYSPYYAPAPLQIYFLRDFRDLSGALPGVRPTVFFSIPRFYEKVWERLEGSPAGKGYLHSRGLMRKLRRRMVRGALLRRAGLDRCRQLIVGSAPCSEEMLSRFRELGIEVHNAYGLTEAPLVTMNRLGRNRIGTVGEPLPQTELKISEKGEILVRGPQVMLGYSEGGDTPLLDGWLKTGDQGMVDEDGYLTILGRMKEVMITSYGKNIQPMKIECMLRSIPGVQEAMLVAEARPFCIALIWATPGSTPASLARIDEGVREMNSKLSRPERIVRWAVIPFDLSVDEGDITANLKVRRSVVERRLRNLIDSLYQGSAVTGVHTGEEDDGD